MKICKKCGELFGSKSCSNCAKIRSRINYQKNIESRRAYGRLYYEANKDKAIAYSAQYKIDNAVKVQQSIVEYRSKNKQKMLDASKKWAKNNPDKKSKWRKSNPEYFRLYEQNRKAYKRSFSKGLSKDIVKKLFVLQKGKCPCCGVDLGDDYHLDHIIPIALCGSHTDQNIQLLKSKCNLQKHSKDPIDFMQSKGWLI